MRYRQGRASSSRPLRRRAAGYNRPTRARTSNCSVRGLSGARRTQRRLHGDIEISIVGLQHADRYISVVNTDTAQWSRPDLCLVAGLGVVAVEERALVGSCDRRTAVGRRNYAVIITLLWLGRRAARPRATTPRTSTPSAKAQKQRSLRLEAGNDARSVSHDRQRPAGILSRRSSPNSTGCPDPTSAAIRKHLPPAPLVTPAPQELERLPGLLTVLARSDITGLKRIITLSAGATQFRGQVVSPAPASGRAQRAALAIDTSSSNSLGSVDNRLHR